MAAVPNQAPDGDQGVPQVAPVQQPQAQDVQQPQPQGQPLNANAPLLRPATAGERLPNDQQTARKRYRYSEWKKEFEMWATECQTETDRDTLPMMIPSTAEKRARAMEMLHTMQRFTLLMDILAHEDEALPTPQLKMQLVYSLAARFRDEAATNLDMMFLTALGMDKTKATHYAARDHTSDFLIEIIEKDQDTRQRSAQLDTISAFARTVTSSRAGTRAPRSAPNSDTDNGAWQGSNRASPSRRRNNNNNDSMNNNNLPGQKRMSRQENE